MLHTRLYTPEDYDGLIALFDDAYAGIDDNYASAEDMVDLMNHFPDGQIVAELDGEIVGVILSLHCKYAQFSQPQRMADIYNPDLFASHSENADSLFALEILVKSTHHRKGIGKMLNAALTKTLERHNLRAFIGISRLSGYGQYQSQFGPEEYVRKVVSGELNDPSLSYNVSNGMMPTQVVPQYYPADHASAGYGTIVIQPNPHYILPIQKSYPIAI